MKVTLKTQANDASVVDFLAAIEPERRRRDALVVQDMMARITGFPPRKQALSLCIMSGFADQGALMAQLGKHRTGRSCLYVNKLDDVDLTLLERLIAESVDVMRDKYDVAGP